MANMEQNYTIAINQGDHEPKRTPMGKSVTPASNVNDRRPIRVTEPVIGWIVTYNGEDYPLIKSADSKIRGFDAVLCESSEAGLSLPLVYDSKNNRFFIDQNGTANPIHVNGIRFEKFMPLEAYDKVTIGDTSVIFMPYSIAEQRIVSANDK